MGTRAILAHDYDAGVRDSDHEVALDGDHLVQILERRWAAESFIEQARLARDEWKQLEARQH